MKHWKASPTRWTDDLIGDAQYGSKWRLLVEAYVNGSLLTDNDDENGDNNSSISRHFVISVCCVSQVVESVAGFIRKSHCGPET